MYNFSYPLSDYVPYYLVIESSFWLSFFYVLLNSFARLVKN